MVQCMVLMAEADQHGWALDYIGFGYCVDKVVFVLECGTTPWVLAGMLFWACLSARHPEHVPACGEACSFIPLFLDDGKLSPVLGMGARW